MNYYKENKMEPNFIPQPNEYSCGTTALFSACKCINIPVPEIAVLMNKMGTNNKTGTTDIEMSKGLALVNLPINRYADNPNNGGKYLSGDENSAFNALKYTLENNRLFLLRALMWNSFHWILTYNNQQKNIINYVCSVSGKSTLNKKSLYKIWSPRNFDGFIIH